MKRHLIVLAAAAAMCAVPATNFFAQNSAAEERRLRIEQHEKRVRDLLAQRLQGQSSTPQSNAASSQTADSRSTASTDADKLDTAVWNTNWQRFTEFYLTGHDSPTYQEFRGASQEYTDAAVTVAWNISEDVPTSRTLTYAWSGQFETSHTINLPDTKYTAYLRNGQECLSVEFGDKGIKNAVLGRWTQPPSMRIVWTGYLPFSPRLVRESVPRSWYQVLIAPGLPQKVNDWRLWLEDGTLVADNELTSGSRIKIGRAKNDGRPVEGFGTVSIEETDSITSAVLVTITEPSYERTLFAAVHPHEMEKAIKASAMKGTLAEVLEHLSRHFGFTIQWADDEALELALTTDARNIKAEGTVLETLAQLAGWQLLPEIVSSTTLSIGVSARHRSQQEYVELARQLHSDYKLETRILLVNRIDGHQAMRIIERDLLECYFIGKPESTDVTSDTLKVQGKYWSILKRPLREKAGLKENLETDSRLARGFVCESIDTEGLLKTTDAGADIIVITATAETHEKIRDWLESIEPEVKEATINSGTGEAAPERRRLQVVLLQGGKAGAPANVSDERGTTVTYNAEVPAQFGMTPADLEVLGFDGAVVLGRGIVELVARPGELGSSRLALSPQFGFNIQYLQELGEVLMVEGEIQGENQKQPLAQNTMLLERGKPAFLGVTNLSGAVIVAVTWVEVR